jgi:hypothetical protein
MQNPRFGWEMASLQNPRFGTDNLALVPGARFTASNSRPGYTPEMALTGIGFWTASWFFPNISTGWWCCQFPEAVIVGKFRFRIASNSFAIEGGNHERDVVRWKNIFHQPTETTPEGQHCLCDLRNTEAFEFCRIVIHQTRNSNWTGLANVVINERVLV